MNLIPFVSKPPPPWCPPDDDTLLWKALGPRLKQTSKEYRDFLESLVRDLEARGSIHCFALTLNVLPQDKAPPTALQTNSIAGHQALVDGSSFSVYVGEILSILAGIDLLECLFITQEFHTEGELKGLPHYHVFLAIRGLFGTEGVYLQAALQAFLVERLSDCHLRRLNTFLDQKKYLNYMVKEDKRYYHAFYVFSSVAATDLDSYYHRLGRRYDLTEGTLTVNCSYLDLPTEYTVSTTHFDRRGPLLQPYSYVVASGTHKELHQRHWGINPPPVKEITVDTLLYCLHLFCHYSGYFLCRGSLYRRRKEARFAYELVSTLDALLEDLTPVYSFLGKEFPFQFKHAANYVKLAFSRHVPEVMARVRKSSVGLFSSVQLNYHLVEFRNGIYNKRIGQFLHFENYPPEQLQQLPFNCYLYFDRYFESYTRMIPHSWLSLLRPQFSSDQELDQFCARFAVLFHGDSIQEKVLELDKGDRALFVEGVSNSGKSRLLADVIHAIVGSENVGLLGSSDNFPLETATDKQVIVADEYRYKSGQRDLLLRMLDGTPLPLDRKHQAQEIISIVAPVLFLANADRNQAMLTDEAFQNRLRKYRFTLVVGHNDLSPLEVVQQELPKILLYCNQRFLAQYGDKFPEIRKLRAQFRSRKPISKRLRAHGFLSPPDEQSNGSPGR